MTTREHFALVTGASSGIGLELARELIRRGFDVLIAAEDEGIDVAALQLGPHATPIRVDLGTREGVERLWGHLKANRRPLDVAAINAGVGVGGAFIDTSLEEELNVIDVNVFGTVHLAKRIVSDMAARGHGHILFTSSIASTMPGPFLAVYAASKAFVQSFSEALRDELRERGVTVTSLMPGPTETRFFTRAHMLDTKVGRAEKDDPTVVARQGIDALLADKDAVVAGSFKNKVQALVAKVLPEPTKARMHRKQAEPLWH